MSPSPPRYHDTGNFHFITFSCYHRLPLLASDRAKGVFERALESVRSWYGLIVSGYVVMPEHVHLLVSEPEGDKLSVAVQMLKQIVSHKVGVPPDLPRFWQRRYYDFNVFSEGKRIEKLKYMHRNPVTRGLVERPEDWAWSSFRHYATGEIGTVEIESQWTATRRERAGMPLTVGMTNRGRKGSGR